MNRVGLAAPELPLSFELNRGQSDPTVDYISRGSGYTIFLRRPEAVLVLAAPHGKNVRSSKARAGAYAVRLKLGGASATAKSSAIDPLPGKVNYFIGNDPNCWRTNIATYRRIQYHDIYPGIDVVYYGTAGQLEYDFVLRPGADPRQIRLTLEGAKSPHVNRSGDLLVPIDEGELVFHKPILYQEKRGNRIPVSGRYSITGSTVRFSVGKYDRSRELVLDPVLAYATYLGGSTNDYGQAITLDSNGAVYLTGYAQSANFPTTAGAYSRANSGTTNAFVTKLTAGASVLTYSTYLGGSVTDQGNGIAVDSHGNAYVTGFTTSANFPVANALPAPNNALQGSQDAFVAEISPDGSTLIYSTYLGGTQLDVANAVAVDASGNAYVAGTTQSTDFPTVNGYQAALAGIANGFVSEIQAGGGTLLYSTFLGGSANDFLNALTLAQGPPLIIYVAGLTQSTNFPATQGVLQPTCAVDGAGNCNDAVVAAINPANSGMSSLVLATFLGGTSMDMANAVAADATGIYVVGTTSSTDFPVLHAAQATKGGGASDAFVAKLRTDGTGLLFSTFVGGSAADEGTGVAVDSNGNTYVTGSTLSTDFPTFNTLPAPNNVNQGGPPSGDAFLTKLNSVGSTLIVSTFLGGTGSDRANAVAVDANGNAYVAGSTTSQDVPVSANAFQPANAGPSGSSNVFFVELSQLAQPVANLSATSLSFGTQQVGTASAAQTVTFSNFGDAPLTISSIATSGDYQVSGCSAPIVAGGSCPLSITFNPTTTGDRPGAVTITDNASGTPRTISLDGTGVGTPTVTLAPTSLAFGQQNVNTTSAAQSVTFANVGSAPLTITNISITSSYVQTNTCPTTLAAGANCTVLVSFSPSTTGALPGQLTFTDNAPDSPESVSLSGTGVVPVASLSPTSLNFGSQNVGTTSAAQTVTLTNSGNGTLTISGVTINGNFTQTNNCPATLAANANCAIQVTFSPQTVGNLTGQVSIADNAAGSPQALGLSGTGVAPAVSLSPATLTFGQQNVGTTSAAQTVTLTNTGSAALTISGVTINGNFTQTNNCPATLAASANCAIQVTFSPQTVGNLTGQVSIADNAAGSPQTVGLSGTGVAPAVSLSPAALAFGSQNVGTTSAAQTVTLTNSGNGTLTISGVTINGNFMQTNNCPATLAASANCAIQVTFSPQTVGNLTGQVSIADNAAGSPQAVGLSGTGVAPAVSLSVANITFGQQITGTTSPTQSVTLTNSGSGNLIISGISTNSPFAISSKTCGATLGAGGACKVSVTFSPTAPVKYTGSLTFADNASNNPQTVTLSGTGVAPAALTPVGATYVTQAIGTTSPPQTFTLQNNQSSPINSLAISTTGDFAVSGTTCTTSLAGKGKCTISVTFTPTVTGTRSGYLQVSDSAGNSPQVASLTGTGALASGTWTLVQAGHCAAGSGVSSCTINLTSNLTPGNLYVFMAYLNSGIEDNIIASVSAAGTLVLEPGCHGRLAGDSIAPSCAYVLPSTSGGGTSPITINFSQQTSASTNWVYMAEFQPNSNGNINVDNAGAIYRASATTQLGPIFTSSSNSDVTCGAIMSGSGSLHVDAIASPYDAAAYMPGTGEAFSCAASNATPSWTLAAPAPAIAMGFSIGINPSPGMEQSLIDFEGGSDGAAPTQATLAASTHGWQGGQWNLGAKTMVYSSAASHPLQNATGRLFGDGINYPSGAGALGIKITGAAPTAQTDYIRYNWAYSNLTDVTIGAWYYTNLAAGDQSANDCLSIHGAGQQFAATNCYGGPNTRYIGLETPAGVGAHIPINSNTWYWIQVRWHFDGRAFTHTIKVWDTNNNLVGTSSYGPYTAPADYPAYVNIGKGNSSKMTNGKIQYLDSIKISLVGDDPIGQ